nr:MAG TPA_asm: hypothetical protein [Caudoviricetes sp.]
MLKRFFVHKNTFCVVGLFTERCVSVVERLCAPHCLDY